MAAPATKKPRRRGARLRATREGRIFVGTTLLLGVAAVNTGNNLLFLVLGLLLSMLIVSGIFSELSVWYLDLGVRAPATLRVGQPARFHLRVRNEKRRLPTIGLSLAIPEAAEAHLGQGAAHVLRVDPEGEVDEELLVRPLVRGPLTLETLRVSTRYPFGILEKYRMAPYRLDLLVLPAYEVGVPLDGLGSDAGNYDPARRVGQSQETIGLRPYRQGDGLRDVHALRSASRGELVVRERASEQARRVTLLLDDRESGEARDAERFERAIVRAASLARSAHAAGMSVALHTSGAAVGPISPGASLLALDAHLARLMPLPEDAPSPAPARGAVTVAAAERAA